MSSKTYFDHVSAQWDTMRQAFFSDSIRVKMCEAAKTEAGKIAADIGAGTGFVTQELIGRNLQVIAVDQSQEMLDALAHKFALNAQLTCMQGDAYALPIANESVDYVMANMFLHHVKDPQKAILEMSRILKSGGRLVIADLDRHDYEFLRTEQFDVWLGFERADIRKWFEKAGLDTISVDDLNETCCCDSYQTCGSAAINLFIASAKKK